MARVVWMENKERKFILVICGAVLIHLCGAFRPNPWSFSQPRNWLRPSLQSRSMLSYGGYFHDQENGTATSAEFSLLPPKANTNAEGAALGDYTGAGTLGDIMSDKEDDYCGEGGRRPTKGGLVTFDGGTLAARFGVTSRLDRMALTANGNLQRLFSSYYDAPVHVVVDKCEQVDSKFWDRVVHLSVHDQTFCTACASVTVHDKGCQSLVESGKVGLGQLFRFLDRLPKFELLDAGYASENGGLWRLYELKCREVTCRIREDFHPNAWKLERRT